MTIEVLKRIDYKGCPIYIRQLDTLFEYLLIYNNRLYSQYIEIAPEWYRRFFRIPYSKKQLDASLKLSISGACATIDKLKAKKKE